MYRKDIAFELKLVKENLVSLIERIDERIPKYRKGSLFVINNYFYLKYYDHGKTVSLYLGKDLSKEKIDRIKLDIQNRKALEKRKRMYLKEIKEIDKLIKRYDR